ncbi:MAG TPA: GntR family transcriptional regulator [Magnetospirillaceae bacterium]|jgi:DNA-binding GntR family transcriptional regulator
MKTKTKLKVRGQNSNNVADILRGRILQMKLRPGEMLDEVSIALELGVSRTPMREALIRLASENLVELIPNRGARVTTLSLHDIRELFEVLEVVQGITTRWAASRRDDDEVAEMRVAAREFHRRIAANDTLTAVQRNFDFHTIIARAAKNDLLASFYSNVLSRTFRLGLITFATPARTKRERQQDLRSIETEHERLVRAIERRDGVAAEALAREHAHRFLERVSRFATENMAAQAGSYEPILSAMFSQKATD